MESGHQRKRTFANAASNVLNNDSYRRRDEKDYLDRLEK